MRDGVRRAGLHAVPAEDAAVVIDVVDRGVTLAAGNPRLFGILRRFNINAIGRARRRAQEAGDALFHTVDIALQDVHPAETLFEFGGLIRVVVRHGGRHHLLEGDAHSLGERCRRTQNFFECVCHRCSFYISVSGGSGFSGSRREPNCAILNQPSMPARCLPDGTGSSPRARPALPCPSGSSPRSRAKPRRPIPPETWWARSRSLTRCSLRSFL